MTREQAKEWLPIIQAFAEGKEIQSSPDGANWFNCSSPTFSPTNYYRIKPEPREFWVNVYPNGVDSFAYRSKADADKSAGEDRADCIKVREVI